MFETYRISRQLCERKVHLISCLYVLLRVLYEVLDMTQIQGVWVNNYVIWGHGHLLPFSDKGWGHALFTYVVANINNKYYINIFFS